MHKTSEQQQQQVMEGGETMEKSNNEPSSPLQMSSRDEQHHHERHHHHRPPMSVVVIQEKLSSESPLGNGGGNSHHKLWAPPPSVISMGSMEESTSRGESWQAQRSRSGSNTESINDSIPPPPSSGFASFKLKPRNAGPFVASPSRHGRGMMGGATRGRKRPANSISIPAGSVSSAESSLRPPRPCFDDKGDDRSDISSTKLESASPGSELTHKDASLSPPIHEMECLHLKSPSVQTPSKASPPSYRAYGSHNGANRSAASSFQMYGPSPAGSVTRAANASTSESSSPFVARTPSSSTTMSSPRHVPLTVLSPGGQNWMSPSKNSLVRPPRHGGSASLLFSLDNSTEDDDSEDEFVAESPRKPPPPPSSNSSISSEEVERKVRSFPSPSSRPMPPMFTSPSSKTASLSPRTPLPRIMLTPRTPQSNSGSSRRKAELPMFPSPCDDDIDTAATTPLTHNSSIEEAMDSLLSGFAGRSGHAAGRFLPSTRYIASSSSEKMHDSSNSLAYSLAFSGGEGSNADTPAALSSPSCAITNDSVKASPSPAVPLKAAAPPSSSARHQVHPVSLGDRSMQTVPTKSNHNEILRSMMEENARERAAHADTTSLSDSCCEEDEFVLTCPVSTKSKEVDDGNQRPRQRRRDSYDSNLSSSRFLGGKESCTSLVSGSASSLFGMEFYHDEGHASPLYRSTPSYSSHSLKSKNSLSGGTLSHKDSEGSFAPLALHHRNHQSEQSFGSLGLNLDGPSSSSIEDQGRDLTTPPVTRHVAFTPPPLASRNGQHQTDSFCATTPKSRNVETKTSPRAIEV